MLSPNMLLNCAVILAAGIIDASAAKPFTDLDKALAAAKEAKQPVFVYAFDSI